MAKRRVVHRCAIRKRSHSSSLALYLPPFMVGLTAPQGCFGKVALTEQAATCCQMARRTRGTSSAAGGMATAS